ncbi:MAG: VOC family protein [Acidobacteria bacterium]|nr:VOC family protein [Acidobacteriota bacterium]
MSNTVKAIPEGFHSITPYLSIRGAADAIEFYQQAFGAIELFRMAGADGKIGHAEIQIGDSIIMLADENPEMGHRSPQALGGSPVGLVIYLEDVDSTFQCALSAGATEVRPLQNQFYGDRMGTVSDPFGYEWSLGSHIEDVSPDELSRRAEAEFAKVAAAQNS